MEQKEFDSDGVRLAYYLEGPADGPPVLLVHGFCSNFQVNWVGSRWVETLSRAGHRVVGLDLRGHGRSEKPHDPGEYGRKMVLDVVRLLDQLGYRDSDYVGYSMGGQVGVRLLVGAERARLRRVVLGGVGINVTESWRHGEAIARRLRGDQSESSPAALMFYNFAVSVPGNDLEALACCITGRTEPVTEEQLRGVSTPVLVAVGGADPIARQPKRLAELIPGAEYFEVPGRDHTTAVPSRAIKDRALEFLEA